MSISSYTTHSADCDSKQCSDWIHSDNDGDYETFRDWIEDEGWTMIGRETFCPECSIAREHDEVCSECDEVLGTEEAIESGICDDCGGDEE